MDAHEVENLFMIVVKHVRFSYSSCLNSILSPKEFSEEKESQDRSGELDTKVFVETCDKIKKLFDQMLEVRKTGSKKNPAKVNHLVENGL